MVAIAKCEALLAGQMQVLYVYGGHGLGKTRLLTECAAVAEQRNMPVLRLDAQCVRPSPSAIQNALADMPACARGGRSLLILDSFESHSALEAVYWNHVLPGLPEGTQVLIAGQDRPAQPMGDIHCIGLNAFTTEESERYLELRGVPSRCREMVVRRAAGIPLLLAAMAEFAVDGQCPDVVSQEGPEGSSPEVAAMLAHIMKEAPSHEHRCALWAVAMPQVLSERLLAAMLDLPGSNACFRWLSSRPYVQRVQAGLILHPLFREALLQDLVESNPALHREYLLRAGRFHIVRIEAARTAKKRTAIMYTHFYSQRSQPLVAGLFALLTGSRLYRDTLRLGQDSGCLEAMVQRREGPAASQFAVEYLRHYPEMTTVFRRATGEPQAFVQTLSLGEFSMPSSDGEGGHDPAIAAALSVLARDNRDAKRQRRNRHFMRNALLVRLWMDADGYQMPCCGQAEALGRIVFSVVGKPELSALLIVCSAQAIAAAEPLIEAGFVQRHPEGDFQLDRRSYGLLGLDLTVTPVELWLRNALSHTITGRITAPADSGNARAPVAW